MPLHPLVQRFADNQAQFLRSDFAGFVLREGDRRRIAGWRDSQAAKALAEMATQGEEPWREILTRLNELGPDDFAFLVDNMPSGWPRAQIMAHLEATAPTPL